MDEELLKAADEARLELLNRHADCVVDPDADDASREECRKKWLALNIKERLDYIERLKAAAELTNDDEIVANCVRTVLCLQ